MPGRMGIVIIDTAFCLLIQIPLWTLEFENLALVLKSSCRASVRNLPVRCDDGGK